MKTNAFSQRFELILNSAILAAHSSAQGKAFRQRDLLFFFELFSNWCQTDLWHTSQRYQNTQTARYLENLTKDNYAKKTSGSKRPTYRLTRSGLLELLFRITNNEPSSPEQFLFTYYFISSYKQRLIELVKAEGSLFPAALKVELFSMLEEKELLKREQERVQKIRLKLKHRIEDAFAIHELSKSSLRKGVPVKDIVRKIQQDYPYELNNQKPLSELIADIPADQQLWEISDGARFRAEQIWQPIQKIVEQYDLFLRAAVK